MGILHITQRSRIVKQFTGWDNLPVGTAEDVFERIRRIALEGEHVERMAALNTRMKLSPGVIKMLMRLSKEDGISMGDVARAIGVDPSYITALVDDLDQRGLARREPAPYDRRVKIIVLTNEGRKLGQEIDAILSVPPTAFKALSQDELRELRDLLDKILKATPDAGHRSATKVNAAATS
jgi:DNA-binding MarR family transcriptional regulator